MDNDKENGKSQKHEKPDKREKQAQKHEDREEEIKKGVIVSFSAKKIGASDKTGKEAEDGDEDEGEDGEEELSREDIKESLAQFGTIRVGYLTMLTHISVVCNPFVHSSD